MNPGQFNRRIKFLQQSTTQNQYGGQTVEVNEVLTTWGALEPVKQYNQFAMQAGASVLNGDVTLKIRFRKSFAPAIDMMFQDVSDGEPTELYIIKGISPYYPGTKSTFQNTQETVYQNKLFVYIVGVKMDRGYLNLYS